MNGGAPRFEAVALRYGCHDDGWVFPVAGRPVVIAGPNGAGKSTLVEGLVRTLYGFDRRRAEDAATLAARTPWTGAALRGRVVLVRDGERFEVEREFATDRVRVRNVTAGTEPFHGDGNPAASNPEASAYRDVLASLVGLRELEAYRQTALIGQGELPGTGLTARLLRVAAGGHTRVEAARLRLRDAYRARTRRPLDPGGRPAVRPRELEQLTASLRDARDRLTEDRDAAARRTPLVRERDRVTAEIADLDGQIERLEDALPRLARTEALELRIQHLDTQLDRLAQARDRWQDRADLEGTPARWPIAPAVGALLAAAALLAVGRVVGAAGAGLLGVVMGGVWAGLWQRVRKRRQALDEEIARLLDGLPDADRPDSDTVDTALESGRARRDRDRRELEQVQDVAGTLPDGVAATPSAVQEALRSLRRRRTTARDELQAVFRRLLDEGTPEESVEALENRVRELEAQRGELERRVAVLRAAHALVTDAYGSFRARDQERLVDHVSRHVAGLTGGRMAGIQVEVELDDARVLMDGRRLRLASPPLSFGQLHALQLGVRLGAADFLAGRGVAPPLIVDEPFAHLDDEAGAAVWHQLVAVADSRQVLVTTQDTRRLDALGVDPDIQLG